MIRGCLDPKSNRETFTEDIQLWANGLQLDLTGVTAIIQLERADGLSCDSDYSPYPWLVGSWISPTALLATTENGGAAIVANQLIRFTFTRTQMMTLPSGQYRLSATVTSDDETMTLEIFQFQIPILDGGVPTS